jgi:phosphatidylinositol alpha-1,6-mannosyltransferase
LRNGGIIMRILLISEIFPPRTGGSGRWFWEIYRRLPEHQVVVAAGEHPFQDDFDRGHDLRVIRMPLTFPSWGLLDRGWLSYGRTIRTLKRLVKAERVGMVHCGRCLPDGLLALALKHLCGIAYFCYVHGEEVEIARTSRELTWLTRRVIFGAEFLIANSRNTQRILREEWRLPASRIRLLNPGVDTHRFVPGPRERSVRERLEWGDRRVVLTVGRLQKRKGHDRMIRAIAAIRNAIPEVLYVIVGDGEEHEALSQLVAQTGLSGNVRFAGELDDESLVECYQQCDLFVLPNRQVGRDIEGFGMVLLEAQACGRPVLAGASGGTRETMRIPTTGRVVPCDRPDELAAEVVDLLSDRDRLEQMGEAARQWVVDHFDWDILSRRASHLFRTDIDRLAPRQPVEVLEP